MLQALEFVVTWLPRLSSPETRAETPLAITCSTAVLPRRRTFLASVSGTTRAPDGVHAADPRAQNGSRVPVDVVVVGVRTREARIAPGIQSAAIAT